MLYQRQRNAILALLLGLAAASWAALYVQAASMDMAAMMSATMGLSFILFLAVWVVMMAAMMFPTAAPMILMFHRVQNSRKDSGPSQLLVWIFVGSYMVVWTAAGAIAYAAATGGEYLTGWMGWSPQSVARAGGLMLVFAGLYQVTPLKTLCLSKCQSPIGFIMTSWRPGRRGAFEMGLRHGLYCLGCCWLLFVILFPLGMMNITAMALLTALIFAEKTAFGGAWLARASGAVLIAYGAAVLLRPEWLPTFMDM